MSKYVLFLLFLVAANGSYGQRIASSRAIDTAKPYGKYYHKPEFTGGDSSLTRYLLKNIRYPDAARDANIEGRVIIRFIVDENGNILDPAVSRGIGGGCDEEAKRVVTAMPRWQPATYKNKPTRAVYFLPVSYKLE